MSENHPAMLHRKRNPRARKGAAWTSGNIRDARVADVEHAPLSADLRADRNGGRAAPHNRFPNACNLRTSTAFDDLRVGR